MYNIKDVKITDFDEYLKIPYSEKIKGKIIGTCSDVKLPFKKFLQEMEDALSITIGLDEKDNIVTGLIYKYNDNHGYHNLKFNWCEINKKYKIGLQ